MATEDPFEQFEQFEPEAWSEIERLGRALHVKEASLQATLDAILVVAVDAIGGTDFAGVNLLLDGKFEPQAVCGDVPNTLDAFQQQTGTGPCIDSSRDQIVIRIDDMRADQRWPEYAELAVSLDVRAMLCVPLWLDEMRLGSVSLYSRSVDAFGDRQEKLANLLATHAALALADAQRTENLQIALRNRDVIGQAKGILMERHRITAAAAFDLLSAASQRTNRKLSAIAEDVANTGQLPS